MEFAPHQTIALARMVGLVPVVNSLSAMIYRPIWSRCAPVKEIVPPRTLVHVATVTLEVIVKSLSAMVLPAMIPAYVQAMVLVSQETHVFAILGGTPLIVAIQDPLWDPQTYSLSREVFQLAWKSWQMIPHTFWNLLMLPPSLPKHHLESH